MISGIRSRIDYLQETYPTKGSKEPYDIRRVVCVFDGTRNRKLTDRIKGKHTTPHGVQSLSRAANRSILRSFLFACDLPLDDMEELKADRLLNEQRKRYLAVEVKTPEARLHARLSDNLGYP